MRTIKTISLMATMVGLFMFNVSTNASILDKRIEASAKKSYVFKTYLKHDNVKVESKDNGMVILTGTVSNESHKSLAAETVTGLNGVKSVENNLEVKGEHASNFSDTWLGDKVKLTLLFHSNVSAGKTHISVENHVVTLTGVAINQAQKELTTEYAQDVEGVKQVKNEMTVSKSSKGIVKSIGGFIDDASITAQVETVLLFHRSTHLLTTKVETKNGLVMVSGKAQNAAEKDLVTKLISDIHGVKSVVNNMTVIGSMSESK